MKTAKEIYELMDDEIPYLMSDETKPYIIEAIEVGQKEAYNQAIRDAVNALERVPGSSTRAIIDQRMSISKLTKP